MGEDDLEQDDADTDKPYVHNSKRDEVRPVDHILFEILG